MNEHHPLILVVDDDPTDAHLLREAFSEANVPVDLEPVHTGPDAVLRMDGSGTDRAHRRPDLVMLNVYLPAMCGKDVLAYIKGAARHRDIPTIMYTSALSEHDRTTLETLGADGYLHKPQALQGYPHIVETILEHLANRFDDEPAPDPGAAREAHPRTRATSG
jgi:CheY-like chemotaxis protein